MRLTNRQNGATKLLVQHFTHRQIDCAGTADKTMLDMPLKFTLSWMKGAQTIEATSVKQLAMPEQSSDFYHLLPLLFFSCLFP